MPTITPPPSSADPQPESSSASPELSPSSPSSPPSPPPPANAPPRNPWNRNVSASASSGAGAGAPLLGELSSWPPLRSSCQIHLTAAAAVTGDQNPSELLAVSASPELSTPEDSLPHQPALVSASPLPVAPPPIPSDHAAVARPTPPLNHRRGRNQNHQHNQRPHNYRGSNNGGGSFYHNQHYNGGGSNSRFVNRGPPPAPGWNPNLGFNPMWQQQQWGILPGATAAAAAGPPMHPYDVNPPPPFSFPINHYDHQFYGGEAYVPYYSAPTFLLPPRPVPAGLPPRQVTPSVLRIAMSQRQDPTLLTQLRDQIEYYFSEENLVMDEYLKRQMDSCGWVDIHLIAGFKRVAALTKDLNMIREALGSSDIVELRGDKMRKKDGWDKWILSSPNLISLGTGLQNMQLAG